MPAVINFGNITPENKMRMLKKAGIVILYFLVISTTVISIDYNTQGYVKYGTYFEGKHIGGLTLEECSNFLDKWWDAAQQKPTYLTCKYMKESIPWKNAKEWGVCLDKKDILGQLSFEGFITKQLKLNNLLNLDRIEIVAQYLFKNSVLKKNIDWITQNLPKRIPAKAYFENNFFNYKKESDTYYVDTYKLTENILLAYNNCEIKEVPLIKDIPEVSMDVLEKIKHVVSKCTTSFPSNLVERCHNIAKCAEHFNGLVLKPGDSISFNDITGPRNIRTGYKKADIYSEGKIIKEAGGGVCQVSSTLYNAVLLAGLKIDERRNHSMPVSYVSVGTDATVNDECGIDLKVTNNSGSHMAISSEIKGNLLTFRLLSTTPLSKSISILVTDVNMNPKKVKLIQDNTLPKDVEKVIEKGGRSGAAKTYRLISENGNILKKEYLGRSVYRGGTKIIAVNRE